MTGSIRCECGRDKRKTREACERCCDLDGKRTGAAEAIWALRRGPLTVEEIAGLLSLNDTGVFRTLQRLERQGRVRRLHEEGEEVAIHYALAERRVAA